MDAKEMRKLGVPRRVAEEFNKRLDDYIETWFGAIDEHRRRTETEATGSDRGRAEDAPPRDDVKASKLNPKRGSNLRSGNRRSTRRKG